MRLLLFTPAARTSAIARVSSLLVPAMRARGDDVVVIRSEDHGQLRSAAYDFGVTTLAWDDTVGVRNAIQRSDIAVYQIGDNYQFHRGCVEWLARLPGIACLHDYFIGNLFFGWAERHVPAAEAIVRTWYSERIARDYMRLAGPAFVSRTAEAAPMTEWVAAMSLGVITHSNWDIDRVLRSCPGPVHVVPLPYEAVGPTVQPVASSMQDQFTVLTVGYVNANKRAPSVIRAIAASEVLRRRAVYRLVGHIDPEVRAELEALAKAAGVAVQIDGEVDDTVLRHAMDAADVMCCLRFPALESASASAIEAMLSGKPVVVIDTGFYRDLPDDLVWKVGHEHEVDDLTRTLEKLEAAPDDRRAVAARAAEWARRTFRADGYAEAIGEMGLRVAAARPAIQAANHFAAVLRSWGAGPSSPVVEDLAGPLRIFEV